MPDYSQGKIYKLINSVNEKVYIGSTCLSLRIRLWGHRTSARKGCTSPLYEEMQRVGDIRFSIVLIENFSCESKVELEKREFHIIRRHIRQEFKLLNSTVVFGKRSDDQNRKMSGIFNTGFKRGSLSRRVQGDHVRWIFQWFEEGKRRSKSFSIGKYGEKRAKRLAENMRDEIYPLKTHS